MALPLDDFIRRITGQPMPLPGAVAPSGPVTAPTPNAAAVAAPTMQQLQQQDFNNAALSRMGQLGMMLVAAGQRMTPRERATILAQAPQYMDGIQNDMQMAAQARLMNNRAQQEQSDAERRSALFERMKSEPGFAEKFGVTPEALATLSPSSLEQIVVHRATQDPLDRAAKLAAIASASKPKFEKVGTNPLGEDQYGWIYPDGTIKPYSAGGGNAMPSLDAVAQQANGKSGKDALEVIKKSYPSLASEVEGIVSGQQPFPTRKLGTQAGAVLNSLVSMVDPSYNAATFDVRKKAQLDQASNQPNSAGGMRKNAEVGLRHFKALMDYSNALPQNDYGFLSGAKNSYDVYAMKRKADEGDPNAIAAMNYLQTMEIGGDEMAKALGIASEGGREKIKELFDPALGRAAVQARIRNQIRLLGEKIGVQDEEWRNTMGPTSQSLIKPEIAEILKLGEDPKPTQAAPQQNNLPHGVRSIRRVN
jgi:hypothetical protein